MKRARINPPAKEPATLLKGRSGNPREARALKMLTAPIAMIIQAKILKEKSMLLKSTQPRPSPNRNPPKPNSLELDIKLTENNVKQEYMINQTTQQRIP
jgi:hypothetical protein